MTIYHIHELDKLADRIRGKSETADKAAADTINKSATFAIKLTIDEITSEVNLNPSYVKQNIKTVARAKHSNLRAIIGANERATLLNRYPFAKTKEGYRVSINRTGGYREIKGAKMMTLRGSGKKTIGVRNKDAVAIFTKSLSRGKRTPKKSRKLQRIISKARTKPNGMTPLHSRSINQLFESARVDIQPELGRFMRKTFLEDFKRYDK